MDTFETLLASDFTARSDRPTERAIRMAAERKGNLVIAHVLEKASDTEKDQIIARLRDDLPPEAGEAELVVREGSAPKTLAAIADERASDLIVTGVARHNSIGDYLLGTAVDHIVRNAKQPVLVVRQRAAGPYKRLLIATDLSDASRAALVAAATLFPATPLTLVHAVHVPYEGWLKSDDVKAHVRAEAEDEMNAFLTDMDPDIRARLERRLVEGETGTVVAEELTRTGADLLVLGTHGRSGFAHATIGSQAEALLSAAPVDVLMVREQQ